MNGLMRTRPSVVADDPLVAIRRRLDGEADTLVDEAYAFDRRGQRVAADALLATAARLREIAAGFEVRGPHA